MVIDEESSSSQASALRPKGLSKNRGSSSLGKLSPAKSEEKQAKLDPPPGFRPDSFLTPPLKDIEGGSSHREVLLVNEDLISKNSADSND